MLLSPHINPRMNRQKPREAQSLAPGHRAWKEGASPPAPLRTRARPVQASPAGGPSPFLSFLTLQPTALGWRTQPGGKGAGAGISFHGHRALCAWVPEGQRAGPVGTIPVTYLELPGRPGGSGSPDHGGGIPLGQVHSHSHPTKVAFKTHLEMNAAAHHPGGKSSPMAPVSLSRPWRVFPGCWPGCPEVCDQNGLHNKPQALFVFLPLILSHTDRR